MPRLVSRCVPASLMLAASLVLVSCGGEAIDILGEGSSETVPVVLANHTGAVICVIMDGEALGGCNLTANGGYRTVIMHIPYGRVVRFEAFVSESSPTPVTNVSCKWRGETAIMVDYQVLSGATTPSLICVVWSKP